MDDSIVKMLDSLSETGIYVITEDTHQILYFNDRIKKVAPFVQIGMVCHEVWSGTCKNCPINSIGDGESNHTINYNDPFGDIVDITASRMLWGGSIPAFAIVVSAHKMSIGETSSELEILQMAKAITTVYPVLISVNLTKGTYYYMVYRGLEDQVIREQGDYNQFIAELIPAVFPEHRELFLANLSKDKLGRMIDSSEQDAAFEFLQQQEDGTYRWKSIRILKVNNLYSEDTLFMLMCRDIDKEKARISALEQKNEEILMTVRDLYFAILRVDIAAKSVRFIRESDDYGDFPSNSKDYTEILLQLSDKLYHPEDKERMREDFSLENILKKIRLEGGRYSEEYRRKLHGEWHWISCTAFFADEKEIDRTITVVLQDVNEVHIKREQQIKENNLLLKAAFDGAQKASEAKSDFLSRMSHDLRTPMNAIMGMAALAESYFEDKERMRECIKKINVSSQHMMELINEVLDMNRIESGKMDLVEEEIKISELIQNSLAMIRPMVEQKEQKMVVQVSHVDHENIYGDKQRLLQIFNNILSNASKYTPEKGTIRFRVEELAPVNKQKGQFRFTVEDTGIGMSEEFLPHIFDPFTRADDSRISKISGSGLGMAITWNLVQAMGGDIRVKSKWGEGATFTLSLTLRLKEEIESGKHVLCDKKILVVDEDDDARKNICNILERLKVDYETAQDPLMALVCVSKACREGQPYFAIIVDKTLPVIDGIELTREIRKIQGSEASAVVLCSYDCSAIAGEAQKAGVNEFMTKPLFASHVEEVLTGIGEKKKAPHPSVVHNETENGEGFAGHRVLLAEDNELNMEIACEMLRMIGVDIETAENGKVAVEMFAASENGYYDLIFMDIQMPELNGYQAALAIRGLKRDDAKTIPIIAMTADAFSSDVQRALNTGMNEHISKPISQAHIKRVLETWISAK